jgi:hypothetical protein
MPQARVQQLEVAAARVGLLEAALAAEQARCERQAEMLVSQAQAATKDVRIAHAATIAGKDATITLLMTALCVITAVMVALVGVGLSHASTMATQVSATHSALTSTLALEIQPLRPDHRQFATLHGGPAPPLHSFDRKWSAAVCGDGSAVTLDTTGARARVTKKVRAALTLRSAFPLLRILPAASSRKHLASYRVVIEEYNAKQPTCFIGLIPSHADPQANSPVSPMVGRNIAENGGWWIQVHATSAFAFFEPVQRGWTVLVPRAQAGGRPPADVSAFATSFSVPAVPPGGAVEFAVDYAAGTCRVAFYSPDAVADGFVGLPYSTLELRFVETEAEGDVPARSVPIAAAESRLVLYPAVSTEHDGTSWRFV